MAVLLDTNFFLGLVHPKDSNAERSVEILNLLADGSQGLLYTTNYVIVETCTLVAVRTNNNSSAFKHLDKILWGENRIASVLWSDKNLDDKTWDLFKKINQSGAKKSKIVSFVDVNLIILAQNHNIGSIVSVDDHFDGFLNRIS